MKKRIDNYERENYFREYDEKTNPFIILTTEIDITNIYELCQNKKHIMRRLDIILLKRCDPSCIYRYPRR